jgi:hypothetical protein
VPDSLNAGERIITLAGVIEILRFRLAAGTDEADFLAADRRLQQEFAAHQPGLLRRTTARGEGGNWIVIDLWRSAADADACDRRWDSDPVAQAFMEFLDRSSVTAERYLPVG